MELEPKGLILMASRDVPAFPREERHHRAPVGTRVLFSSLCNEERADPEALEETPSRGKNIQCGQRKCVMTATDTLVCFLLLFHFFAGLVLRSVEITR